MALSAFILAAGEGTRMKSAHPKVTHEILGRPLVAWPVAAARAAGAERIVCVSGSGAAEVDAILAPLEVEVVHQEQRLGTAHAAKIALGASGIDDGVVVVLYGDTPLIEPETIEALAAKVADEGCAAAVLTMVPADPSGYGRIVVGPDGVIEAIIEHRDATEEERETLLECNSGVYAFDGALLASTIDEVGNDNVQHEYYLTDLIAILRSKGLKVARVVASDPLETLGVNSRIQLAEASRAMQARINARLMDGGVTMVDPSLVWVGPDVRVGADTVLWPLTFLMGATSVGRSCSIGPNSRLTNVTCADGSTLEEVVAMDATIDEDVSVGPRSYLRPGTHLLRGSHVGTSVEIKNSTVGEGSKVPHLSYIGDTDIGADTNIGAATITCNYDGFAKHRTTIGDRAFIGSDTILVSPVSVGSDAITGAASCITSDVPDGALAIERSRQQVVDGYSERRRLRRSSIDDDGSERS